jgi:hypothetical protein
MIAAMLGLALGFIVGGGCRFLDIPPPAPPLHRRRSSRDRHDSRLYRRRSLDEAASATRHKLRRAEQAFGISDPVKACGILSHWREQCGHQLGVLQRP